MLNAEQKNAVNEPIDATVKILAGAGTGKTRVLVERYLKFIFEDGVPPGRLLALTFTKKAAAEMYERVFSGVMAKDNKDLLRELYGAWIINFHQFAFRVIKENAAAFGIDPDTQVASEVDLDRTRRRVEARFLAGGIDDLPSAYEDDMPPPNGLGQYVERCMDIVSKARGTLWTIEALLATVREDDVPAYRRYIETIAAMWRTYEDDLRQRSLLDFDDLMAIVVNRFQRDHSLRKYYSSRFAHILVDEFQDTSEAQNELLRLLSGGEFKRVTVVGDEKQSIYRWRDARVENIREFAGAEHFLRTNYRSVQSVLDSAYHLIVEDPYFQEHAEEIRLSAARGDNRAPICLFHPQESFARAPEEEAKALTTWILAVTGQLPQNDVPFAWYRDNPTALAFGDIAILMRSLKPASGLPEYETELQRAGIPYAIMGGVSALETTVLERFRSLLQLLLYPDDARAFLAVAEAKPFCISDSILKEFFEAGGRRFDIRRFTSSDVLAQLSDSEARERLAALRGLLDELDGQQSQLDLADFITEAIERTPFFYQLFDEGADLRIVDSVSKRLIELVEGLSHRHESNLASFLEALNTLLVRKQFGEEDAPYVPPGRVIIMTQHQAKGLEFPAVAIPGIKRQSSSRDGFYLVKGQGLFSSRFEKWNRGTKGAPLVDEAKVERAQEERCLLYVAMTRAKDHLFLSTPHANGVEKFKKENLFTTVLRTLRENGIVFDEKREIAADCQQTIISKKAASVELGKFQPLLGEWNNVRNALEYARSSKAPAASGLRFVSWRGLHTFSQCPLQYYYRYVSNISDDLFADGQGMGDTRADASVPDMTALPKGIAPDALGRIVHEVLFELLRPEARPDLGDVIERVVACSDIESAERQRVTEATREILDVYVGGNDAAANVVEREWPIRFRVGGSVFHGIIDRLDHSPDGYTIIDYKIGTPRDLYANQIEFYVWVASRILGAGVPGGRIVYLHKKPSQVDINVSVKTIERLNEMAEQLDEACSGGDFVANPGAVCGPCEFNGVCEHARAETL